MPNIQPGYYNLLGANVTIRNESGTIVGVATLPQTGKARPRLHPDQYFDKDCAFDVPVALQGSANFYEVGLGSGYDPVTFSRPDLVAAGWRIVFSY